MRIEWLNKDKILGFPGGSVANAGDTGSIPAPGRSHVSQDNWAYAPQPLNLCPTAQEPRLLSSRVRTAEARVLQGSSSAARETAAVRCLGATREQTLLSTARGKAQAATETQCGQINT